MSFIRKHWKVLLGISSPFLVYAALYAYYWADRVYQDRMYPIRAAEAQEAIGNIRLTLRDADGTNLPPAPDTTLNKSTVAGIDVNVNHIRDDVELAMYDLYPIDMQTTEGGAVIDVNFKKRAAVLQYAQALQVRFAK